MSETDLGARTIDDFGEQWRHHGSNEGYYGSVELLQDLLGPLLPVGDLAGRRVAEVGSGTGRIARMILEAGAEHLTALEPSAGVDQLRRQLAEFGDRVEIVHSTGDALPADGGFDFAFSIGVLQFVPDPVPVLQAMRDALAPEGRIVVWVYSREGNRAYLAVVGALRAVTTRLPHPLLSALCGALNGLLDLYILAARILPLPKYRYLRTTLSKFSRKTRRLVIYDQLNPSYVKWYSRADLEELLRSAGLVEPRLHHRHGYSWTAVARKP